MGTGSKGVFGVGRHFGINRVIFIDPTDETNHSVGVIMPISLQASLPGFDDDETEEGYNDESTNE